MTYLKNIVLCCIWAIHCVVHAADQDVSPRFVLAPSDVATVLPAKLGAVPEHAEGAARRFLDANVALVKEMVDPLGCVASGQDIRTRMGMINHRLNVAGFKNKSKWNFVIKVSEDHVLKAAGPAHVSENFNAALGQQYGSVVSRAQIEGLADKRTYQTISRAAMYLALNHAINDLRLSHLFGVPATHVIPIQADDTQVDVCDTTHVVVQACVQGEHPSTALLKMREVYLKGLIQATGLWNIKHDGMIVAADERIYFVDLEQPSNSNPRDFFHRNPAKFASDVRAGMQSLNLLLKNPEREFSDPDEGKG